MTFYVGHSGRENKNRRHYPISVERTWATKCWPERCHAYFLALTEVNENYPWGCLVYRVDVEPQLDFWRQLGWDMVENTLDEETEAGGVDGRRLVARKGILGDH